MRRSALAVLLALAVPACAPTPTPGGGPPLVVVSIHPIADLVARIGGDAIRVETLLPPRASLHTWEATPAQIRSLNHAAGYVTLGGGLDGWLDGLGGDPGPRSLRLTDGMELRGRGHAHDDEAGVHADEVRGTEGTGDPHVWLDPVLTRDVLVPRLTEFLVAVAPEWETELRTRARNLAEELTALDREVRDLLSTASNRSFIATHDAWFYFSERYGLTPLGTLYESPGHEPSARGLARLVDAARSRGLGAILSEPQLAATAAQALAGEIDAEVVVVDPLGGIGVEGRESYFDLMRFNARAFRRALGDS